MPELPEVETIKLGLQKRIIGLRISKIEVFSPKSFINNPKEVEGKNILNIWRRAKILGMDLDDEVSLLVHLKMSGQLVWKGDNKRFVGGHPTEDMAGEMPNKHTRVIFTLESQESRVKSQGISHLYFNDQRKFGWIRVIDNERLRIDNFFNKLGPEPLEKGFSWQVLKTNLLKHKSQPVKVAIMDQSVVAGVGNIYANEACFDAKLDPRTKVKDLNDKEFKSLYRGVIRSLQDGIKYGGSSRAHFVDSEGHKGYFLDYAYVYGKDKHPCKKCSTQIKKIQLGGRGTYYCSVCQR